MLEELEGDLRATVLESYKALSSDYVDAYIDGIAEDKRVLLIDVEADDVIVGFDLPARAAAGSLRGRVIPGRGFQIVSKALEVHLSADKTVGWVFDEISYRVKHKGKIAAFPLRVTSVYERHDSSWLLVAKHVSRGVPDDDALALAMQGRAPLPKTMGTTSSSVASVKEVQDILQRLIHDEDDSRVRHVSLDADSLLIGSDPDRERRGPEIAEEATIRSHFGYDMSVRGTDLRVELSRSGSVAWAAANVIVEGARADRTVTLPLRVTWVLERRDNAWVVVQAHSSMPVRTKQMASLLEEVAGGT
ncbi:MAG: nuclear transport factor 2 family protein [Deltaproteobacteria bacterium]|nr:nuclear transport factor 2 family protein [Deltaproteobacteria bacterium]